MVTYEYLATNLSSLGIVCDNNSQKLIIEQHYYKGTLFSFSFFYRENGDMVNLSISKIGGSLIRFSIRFEQGVNKYVIKVVNDNYIKTRDIVYLFNDDGEFHKYYDFDGNYWDDELGMEFYFPKPKEHAVDLVFRLLDEHSNENDKETT